MSYKIPFREISDRDEDIVEFARKEGKSDSIKAFVVAVILFLAAVGVPIWMYINDGYVEPLFLLMWSIVSFLFILFFVKGGIRGLKPPQGICEAKVVDKRINENRDSDGATTISHYITLELDDGATAEHFVTDNEFKRIQLGSAVYLLKIGVDKKGNDRTRLVVPK
ncbi:MAG: hypothetical protein MJ153_08980 [Clostridia bacterium]|nr:hypothetical protein [Clostridia bacterium]